MFRLVGNGQTATEFHLTSELQPLIAFLLRLNQRAEGQFPPRLLMPPSAKSKHTRTDFDPGGPMQWVVEAERRSGAPPPSSARRRASVRSTPCIITSPELPKATKVTACMGAAGWKSAGSRGRHRPMDGRAAHIGMGGARHLAVRDRRCRHRGSRLAPSDRRFWRSAAVKDSVSRVDAFALFTPQVRVECWRKKRTISRLASGPRGSVNDPAGLPPDHAWPAP